MLIERAINFPKAPYTRDRSTLNACVGSAAKAATKAVQNTRVLRRPAGYTTFCFVTLPISYYSTDLDLYVLNLLSSVEYHFICSLEHTFEKNFSLCTEGVKLEQGGNGSRTMIYFKEKEKNGHPWTSV